MSGEGLTSVGVTAMGKRRPALSVRALAGVVLDAAAFVDCIDFVMGLHFVDGAGGLGLRVSRCVGGRFRGIYWCVHWVGLFARCSACGLFSRGLIASVV